MDHKGNIGNIPKEFCWQDQVGMLTRQLSKTVGSSKLYVNLDSVPKGAHSTKYHTHSQQEEFFYILAGCGSLRLNGENYPVTAGDFLAKPAGQAIAHTFMNQGDEPLLILDIGTVEAEDTCFYPDEDVYLHKLNGTAHAYRSGAVMLDWSSDPNR